MIIVLTTTIWGCINSRIEGRLSFSWLVGD
jgi:hypothetical protein